MSRIPGAFAPHSGNPECRKALQELARTGLSGFSGLVRARTRAYALAPSRASIISYACTQVENTECPEYTSAGAASRHSGSPECQIRTRNVAKPPTNPAKPSFTGARP